VIKHWVELYGKKERSVRTLLEITGCCSKERKRGTWSAGNSKKLSVSAEKSKKWYVADIRQQTKRGSSDIRVLHHKKDE
jgi:hypothetical protein